MFTILDRVYIVHRSVAEENAIAFLTQHNSPSQSSQIYLSNFDEPFHVIISNHANSSNMCEDISTSFACGHKSKDSRLNRCCPQLIMAERNKDREREKENRLPHHECLTFIIEMQSKRKCQDCRHNLRKAKDFARPSSEEWEHRYNWRWWLRVRSFTFKSASSTNPGSQWKNDSSISPTEDTAWADEPAWSPRKLQDLEGPEWDDGA
jgi:hypothetical protein